MCGCLRVCVCVCVWVCVCVGYIFNFIVIFLFKVSIYAYRVFQYCLFFKGPSYCGRGITMQLPCLVARQF